MYTATQLITVFYVRAKDKFKSLNKAAVQYYYDIMCKIASMMHDNIISYIVSDGRRKPHLFRDLPTLQ